MPSMVPIYDINRNEGRQQFQERLKRLASTVSLTSEAAQNVAEIVEAVRCDGDEAIVRFMRQWTDPDFTADRIRVSADELAGAADQVGPVLLDAIDAAIDNVTAYQQHVMPVEPETVEIDGAKLGMRWSAVDSAGMLVPGGTAVLFSTLIMTAVPALVAGVPPERIAVAHPPPTRGAASDSESSLNPSGSVDISPVVLATAHRLGISKFYRVGGAQGVAALAFGTDSVESVDLVAGPGNVYVQLAKTMVNGACGTDNGFYGPSEIVVIADDSADPALVASDLIAQAEHDPGKCFLLCWSFVVMEAVLSEVASQLKRRERRAAIEAALAADSCVVLCADEAQAIETANTLATEHLSLAVKDPQALLPKIRHAGEIFLGNAPVAAGDYHAGPSHCLPTGTTARFASGISVYTFLKRTGTVAYPDGLPTRNAEQIARMAKAEGLDGHAASATLRADPYVR